MSEKYYRVADLAEKFQVHVKTVQGWIRSGQLEAYKVGRAYRITEDQLIKYLETNTHKGD